MSRRNKWIVIVVLGCVVCVSAWIAYDLGQTVQDMRMMSARRSVLLYQTDHRALLKACRELSRQVTARELEPGYYQIHRLKGDPDPRARQFPKPILELDPLMVIIDKDGHVNIAMLPLTMYGVYAYPENYEGSRDYPREWRIKLIDGLWYYDEDFGKRPERKKEIEELLKKRKTEDTNSVP